MFLLSRYGDGDQRAQKGQYPEEFMTSVLHNTRSNVLRFSFICPDCIEMGFVLLTSIKMCVICSSLIEMGFHIFG